MMTLQNWKKRLRHWIAANATNSVKLRELMEKKEETENALDEKMDRWVYLNDLNEKIQDAKQQG